MKRTFVWAVSVATLIGVGTANAASPKLKGEYAFTGSAACLVSGTPFNANLTPSSFTVSTSFSVVGIRTFNGDGTGTIKGRSVSINPPPVTNTNTTPPTTPLGGISANNSDFTASFTYSIDSAGLLTTQLVPGSFLGTGIGPSAGSTFTVDNFSLVGMMSVNNETIVLATPQAAEEIQTITPTVGAPFNRYRICHRSRVLIRTGN